MSRRGAGIWSGIMDSIWEEGMEVQALHEARYACVGRGSGEQEQLDQKYGGGVLKRQGTKECVCV